MNTSPENCRNCGAEILENYCGNCGQQKYHRIDRKHLMAEFQYILVHTNKGFFYTLKNLLKNPGKTAREYIDGKRVKHYKPILLAFVLSGLSVFVSHYIFNLEGIMKEFSEKSEAPVFMSTFFEFFMKWYSIISVLLLPIFSLATYISFRKWRHNFYEHIIMNAFFMSFYTVLHIAIFTPLLYFLPQQFSYIAFLNYIAVPVLLFLFFRGVYAERKWQQIALRILILCLICVVFFFVSLFIIGVFYAMFASSESLKEFQK